MANLLVDAFTRADSAVSPGSPTTGGPYTAAVATWGISSNALYTATSTAASALTFPAAIDVDFQAVITVGSFTPNPSIMIRRIDANNFWWLAWATATQVGLYRVVGGTAGLRAPFFTFSGTAPLTLRLVGFGRTIDAYANGTRFASVEDEALVSATTTCGFRHNSSTAVRYDDALAVDSAAYAGATTVLSSDSLFSGTRVDRTSQLWKGRDRASLDDAAAA
jgi:hypothetical protein